MSYGKKSIHFKIDEKCKVELLYELGDVVPKSDDPTPLAKVEIDGEEMFVTSKSNNTITVERGADNTTAVSHLTGAEVKSIDYANDDSGLGEDSALVELGDDFGFSGEIS